MEMFFEYEHLIIHRGIRKLVTDFTQAWIIS